MLRSFAAKSVLSMAAGASIFLFSPMAPHALAQTASAGNHAAVTPDTPPYILVGTAYSYPDTSAGLSACDTEGAYLQANSQYHDIVGYNCTLSYGIYYLYLIERV